jgi:hypothetical protein
MSVACVCLPPPLCAGSQHSDGVKQVCPYHLLPGTWHLPASVLRSFDNATIAVCLAGIVDKGCQGRSVPWGSARFWRSTMSSLSHAPPLAGLSRVSWCLAEPCCARRRVVCDAEAQGRMGCLYTSWHFCIPPVRVHGAPRCPRQLLVGLTPTEAACDAVLRRAMEFVPRHPHAIPPATGPGRSAHRGGGRILGTRPASSPPHRPRGNTTGLAPRTRPLWQASPCDAALMLRVAQRGRVEEPHHAG